MIEALKSDEIVNKVGGRFKLTALIQKRRLELMDGARPLVERGHMTDIEVAIEEILQDKIAIDYAASGLGEPTDGDPIPYRLMFHFGASPEAMSATTPTPPLKSREIIVGVCGGIAAYKVADLVSKLVQAGAGVTVCMTPEAQKFVTPLTFEALSSRPVRTSTFELVESSDPQHISLTERADLMVVAPATNNIIAKVAHGLTDDLVSLMICAAACPVVFAPAMNNRMWAHRICQENVAKLKSLNYRFIGPEDGWLACRNIGPGRMSEPAKILAEVQSILAPEPAPQPAGGR